MPSARAPTRSRLRTTSGGAVAEFRGGVLPGLALRPGEEREARSDQVERRDESGRPRQPDVLDALAEVDAGLASHVPVRAVRVCRAHDVVLDDGPALALVGVEQRRIGPAAQHPAELPAEVEAVVDRGVHAGAAARRDAVGRIADQERALLTEVVGDLRREREGADPLDLRLELGYAGAEPDQLHQPLLVEVGRLLDLGIPVHAVEPAVVPSGGQEEAHGIGTDDAVDAVPMLADHVPERRPEQGRDDLREVVGASHGDAQSAAHGAVRTVGRDEVAGAHDPLVPARRIPHDGMHAVGPVVHADDLGRESARAPVWARRWLSITASR